MHFTHLLLLLLTVPLAAATPNPQPGINYLIDYVTNIAESAADLGGGVNLLQTSITKLHPSSTQFKRVTPTALWFRRRMILQVRGK